MSLTPLLSRHRLGSLSDHEQQRRVRVDILEALLLNADILASCACSYLLLTDLMHS